VRPSGLLLRRIRNTRTTHFLHRKGSRIRTTVSTAGSLGVATGLGVLVLVLPASVQGQPAAGIVQVKLGDALSIMRPARTPVGPVVFRVVNRGSVARSFAIGSARRSTIAPGSSATLRLVFAHAGSHQYVSSGRRVPRLTGVLEVFAPCVNPTTIPCGTVTFVVSNTGTLIDSLQAFADYANARGTTPELEPGQTAAVTIHFTELGNAYVQSGDYPPAEPEFGGDYGEGATLRIV
jgi:hypothetical protein